MNFEKRINKKIKHLKKHGFKNDDLTEIRKMYSGDFFNPNDEAYKKLISISNELCDKYNHMGEDLGKNPSLLKIWKNYNKKRKIIKILFPIKGILSSVGPDLQVVIGQVDFLGCGFMNKRCRFSKYSLVECGNFTMFGNMIDIGDETIEKKDGLIKLGRVTIGRDSWICAGVKINNNVNIGRNVVVGCGAHVESDINSFKLAIGRPAIETKDLPKKAKIDFTKHDLILTDEQKDVIEFVKSLGFKGGLKEYKKAMLGFKYNSTNLSIARIFLYSHRLCVEYNSPSTTEERKKEILDILFYNHGANLKVGKNLYVDLLGLIKVGDNVTIGDDLCISGNIMIGDNVKIGNNVSLFSTGHGLAANERKVGFSLVRGLYEFSTSDSLLIKNDVVIGDNVAVAPKAVVDKNVKANSLYVKDKVIS